MAPFSSGRTKNGRESMNTDSVIKCDAVSKKFAKSLKRSMFYGMNDIARNIVGLPAHTEILRPDEFWALDNLTFEVKKGETLGIIGSNGSGKTTVLKLLSGILLPDKGRIEINGKIGALIEIGAGFHPMLTGRENIYINGSILGMGKKEIDQKMDSIIDFADIGDFIDSPVKHYSSGMYVRLGFATAIHCDPDILLVDEVMAVGDLDFQIKCFDKMGYLRKKGTPIVFISHNMDWVSRICSKTIVLDKGHITCAGDTLYSIKKYLQNPIHRQEKIMPERNASYSSLKFGSKKAEITVVEFSDAEDKKKDVFKTGEDIFVHMKYVTREKIENPTFGFAIYTATGFLLTGPNTKTSKYSIPYINGKGEVTFEIVNNPLLAGTYYVTVTLYDNMILHAYDHQEMAYKFTVETSEENQFGILSFHHQWKHHKTEELK
ncbi:MAG: ABC transporter ATP-binding protein [Candidatus Omnitrophica bacterium]|nr:ABC transporter ATP-binding protein [Candidatus Omnitrophota bacterium]